MTPPAEYPIPVDAPPAEPQRCLPTPFLCKTYQLVDDHSIDDIISWNEDGPGFIVWKPTQFARDLLPKHFKHNKFSSFVRQLNIYGFRKIVPNRWEFSNESFRRGKKQLLCKIQRRKVTPPSMAAAATSVAAAITAVASPQAAPAVPPLLVPIVPPSNYGEEPNIPSTSLKTANLAAYSAQSSISECSTELISENERLRKENMKLTKELSQIKMMCDNIYNLMWNFASKRPENGSMRALDLLMERNYDTDNGNSGAMGDGESSTRIFGFQVGAKRMRECEGQVAGGYDQDLQLRLGGMGVKSEPSDRENSSYVQECMSLGMSNGRHRKL